MARQYRTLSDLRAELRAALGFGSTGASAGPNQTLLDSALRDAQTILYYTHDWAHLRRYETKQTGAAATLVDYPATANPDRITAISVYRGGVWSKPLPKGITPQLYTYQGNASWPQRWEPYEQIEIWPQTDVDYAMRIFFIKSLERFTQDGDRASIDDTMVMLLAKSNMKAHYRQPDAALYATQSTALLDKLKAKSWGQSVFNPGDFSEQEPLVRPVTV